jgi:hypothetical protein
VREGWATFRSLTVPSDSGTAPGQGIADVVQPPGEKRG